MKYTIKNLLTAGTILALTTAAILAQTALKPQKVDWRYDFYWQNLNGTNFTVTGYTVYASNVVTKAVRMSQTRETQLEIRPLLNGAPSGVYALFATLSTDDDDISLPSPLFYVIWPGGDGRPHPPHGPKAEK
jgi:hypothetical protein